MSSRFMAFLAVCVAALFAVAIDIAYRNRRDWLHSFAVIAIAFPADNAVSSVVNHPSLGRLMIFDPTDPETPVGELPDDEQGSFALIVAGDRGGIAR